MIFVDRKSLDSNGNIIEPNEDWYEKAKNATDDAIQNTNHSVSNLYKDDEVKKALEKLFSYKCAYCEMEFDPSNWDVEHYRPANGVIERKDHSGYKWLAYTWDNLFPSCIGCNQLRKDKPTWDDPSDGPAMGKHHHFPVEDEALRAMSHEDDINNEQPLLLNPCKDDPSKYFTFNLLGEIIPLAIEDYDRAEKSIKIYNLKRKRLRELRAKLIEGLTNTIKEFRKSTKDTEEVKKFENALLKNFSEKNKPYSAVVKSMMEDPSVFGL